MTKNGNITNVASAIIFLNTKLFHKKYVQDFSLFVIEIIIVDDFYVIIETKLMRYKLKFCNTAYLYISNTRSLTNKNAFQ